MSSSEVTSWEDSIKTEMTICTGSFKFFESLVCLCKSRNVNVYGLRIAVVKKLKKIRLSIQHKTLLSWNLKYRNIFQYKVYQYELLQHKNL